MITELEAREALTTLEKYKQGKQSLDNRIIENEEWWKMRHWKHFKTKDTNKETIEPTSAWTFNSIINKHADFMDNYPESNILAREETDEETAKMLSDIIPYVIEANNYEECYSDETWQKLIQGTGIYGIFWNQQKENGLGDIEIRRCDPLRMYWEPGIDKIQDSKNLFYLDAVENDILIETYPELEGKLSSPYLQIKDYLSDDYIDNTNKSLVIDWYYKKTVLTELNGIESPKTILHYAKLCNGIVLYASENDPSMAEGWYHHGQYPFVFDVMFPTEKSPFGFGYLDIMKDCQMYIDKMGQAILKNAISGSRPRYFSKDGAGINEEEFTDLSKDIVHFNGNEKDIFPIETKPLASIYYSVYQGKVEELKETSGNRDFSQGSTTSGVTAASAIAALQEAGSKLSRDMIKSSFRAHRQVTYMVLELIRQFYNAPRAFRITNKTGETRYMTFSNENMQTSMQPIDFSQMMVERRPVYDIIVTAQKASPFTKISQNELAKEMYQLGFFNPELSDQALVCLDMMMFDGKEEVMQKVSENGTLYNQVMNLQQMVQQMAQIIQSATGDGRLVEALGVTNIAQPNTPQLEGEAPETDAMGNITNKERNSTAGKARERAAKAATPEGMG